MSSDKDGLDSLKHDSSSSSSFSSNKQFTFTIQNGVVTAFFEVENGKTEQESIDSRDSFEVNGNQITHTKQSSHGSEVTVYSDPDGDGFYNVVSKSDQNSSGGSNGGDDFSSSGNHKAFKFDIENGLVTAVFELKDGVLERERIDDDGSETFTVDGNDVVRTEIKPFGTEITRFSDPDGDGFFFRASEQFQQSPNVPSNTATHKLLETLRFSPTNGDDFIAVREGEDCRGGQGADKFVVREAKHLRIDDFSSLEKDMLVFDTGLGLMSKEHLASFIKDIRIEGENFIVDFSSDVSITLVGVKADQISFDDVEVLS